MTQKNFDFLIIGSGMAGLTFALKTARLGTVAIITKKQQAESNTNYAQGGIAAVMADDDSFDLHVSDTLNAGAGLCREDVVRTIVGEGPALVRELIELGVSFTAGETPDQQFDLGREGGHSKRRILHAGDITGREIERALLHAVASQPNISVFENVLAVDFITSKKLKLDGPNRCLGCYALNEKTRKWRFLRRPILYWRLAVAAKFISTRAIPTSRVATGWRWPIEPARVSPTWSSFSFIPPVFIIRAKSFLISEAVRGEGGLLRGADGERFMDRYDQQAELAPRDIVARAIDAEMKKTGADSVWLDISHRDADFIKERFPNIYTRCLEFGFDMTREPIPVVPAAHYQCGGVVTNVDGETGIAGLFAAGEVGCTGLHGANRLASNSLLEALVVAHRAAGKVKDWGREETKGERVELQDPFNSESKAKPLPSPLFPVFVPAWKSGRAANLDELVVITHNWDEIRRCMWDYVGIVRTDKRLLRARSQFKTCKVKSISFTGTTSSRRIWSNYATSPSSRN